MRKAGRSAAVPEGFVALRPERATPPAVLLEHCRNRLVAFTVLPAVAVIGAVHKTANGRIDRDALAALRARRTGRRS